MPRTISWSPPATPFTLAHIAPLGVTAAMLRGAEHRGTVTRLAHGVFVATSSVPGDPVARHLQLALALQLRNPLALASHHTAALAWDLDLADPIAAATSLPTFITPSDPSARSKNRGTLAIAVRDLPIHHRTAHPSGLRLTTPARAAVDVASTCATPEALITLDSAARLVLREHVGERRLRDAYAKDRPLADSRAPLIEAVRSASTLRTRRHLDEVARLADPRRESANESLSYGHFLQAELPLPELQIRIQTPQGDAYPDFLWTDARVIGEADGAVKYVSQQDLVSEKRRQEALEQMGFRVVRWMYTDLLRRPSSVMARIRAILEVGGGL